MSNAWSGDWNARIQAFARREGYDGIWNWMSAHPRVSLLELAKLIGDAAAIQIQRLVTAHCLDNGLMGECLRDSIVRGIHQHLPNGWGSKNDFQHAMALTATGAVPDPYSELASALSNQLLRTSPPPHGWLAIEALPQAKRDMIARGAFIKPPGSIYAAAIDSIWKSVSIHEGPEVFLRQYTAVRTELGQLFAAHWCISEVGNGGFHQFFTNSTGVLAPEALAAFTTIGMPQCAAVVAEAISFFGRPYPRDREFRIELLNGIPGESREEWDPFFKLDDRFYALLDAENGGFNQAADAFAKSII